MHTHICVLADTLHDIGRDGIEEVAVGAVAVFDGHIGHVASQMASDVFLDKLMLKVNGSIEQS